MVKFNLKNIIILALVPLFVINTSLINASTVNNDFSGQWCWDLNNEISAFSLKIIRIGSIYKGEYDSVAQKGNKIDDNDEAFSFKILRSNIVKTKLKAGITGNMGLIQLAIIGKNKLKWLLLQRPRGEIYVPDEAILHRCY